MRGVQGLTPRTGVLCALYLADGEVLGITRLNKLLARLQRDGFPITNQFMNAQMGPYDPMIDTYATQLSSDGLITRGVSSCEYYENDRQDFFLTPQGKLHVETEVIPLLERDPFYGSFMESYMNIKDNYKNWPSHYLVDTTHEELCISPDNSRFLTEAFNTRETLIREFNDIERTYKEFCYVGLVLLGSLEFGIRCLGKILESYIADRATGKNNILVNSRALLENVIVFRTHFNSKLDACAHNIECEDGLDCLTKELNNIKYSTHCIEMNSRNYKILDPFSEEWELTDYMTEQEVSLFTSCPQTMNTTV